MDPKFSLVIEATFPLVRHADEFEANCSGPNNWVRPGTFTRKGRVCTWIKDVPADATATELYEATCDTLEQVGYYGSTQARKAKVTIALAETPEQGGRFLMINRPAPVSY